MKKLLFLLSLVISFVFTSCQNHEVVAKGELTAISKKSATINGLEYQTQNGTTDFILDNEITVDGEEAYIYASGSNFYVSKAKKEDIKALNDDSSILALTIITVMVALLGYIIKLLAEILRKQELNCRISREVNTLISCMVALIFPTICLILGRSLPEKLGQLSFTSSNVELCDYGTLSKFENNTAIINNKVWKINQTTALNTKKAPQINKTYAVIEKGHLRNLFETNSVKQLQTEINFIKNKQGVIYEIIIYILTCSGVATPVGIYFARRPNKRRQSYVSEDGKNGHSVE